MSLRLFFIITFAFLTSLNPLFIANKAVAQGGEDKNQFRILERRHTRGVVKGPFGKYHNPSPSNRYIESAPQDAMFHRDTDYMCAGENCGEKDELAEKLAYIGIKESEKSLNVFAPLAGLTDTLYSQVHADQLTSSMESPMVLYHATMLLTEPAVGSAINAAMLEATGSLQNRYLAEQHFAMQLDQQPITKEIILRAYNSCLSENIRHRAGPSGDSDAETDHAGWIAAQSKCMADRISSASKLGNGAEDFNEFEGAREGETGAGFDFWFDPANRMEWEMGKAPDQNIIRLSDYLFNESTTDKAGATLSSDEIETLKENFAKFIGDYEFTLDSNAPTSGGIKRSASRSLKYTRKQPEKTFVEWHREKEEEIYNMIMSLVRGKCEFTPDASGAPFQENHLLCAPGGEHSDAEDFIKVSVSTFQFDCAMIDMIYAQFRKTNPEIDSGGAACSKPFNVSLDDIKNNPDQKRRGHQLVYFLASRIATAQIYANMVQFQQILNGLTSSNRGDSFVRTFSMQLVEQAAGSEDFMEQYTSLSSAMNDKVRVEMQENMAKDSGRAVRVFADALHISKTSPGTLAANPQQGGN